MSLGKFPPIEWLRRLARNAFRKSSLVCLAAVLGTSPLLRGADLPLTRLDSVSPAAATPGQEVELTLAGADFDGVDTLWFSHPGITAAFSKDKTFKANLSPDVPEGIYDVRAVGKNGVSNPRSFVVDRVSTKAKTGECSFAAPMELKTPQAVFGVVAAAGRDHYRFNAKRGERFTIRCLARELDSKMTPVVTVLDESGRQLASGFSRSAVDFRVPSDSAFLIRVHDLTFSGGADYFYRLSVDQSPIVDSVFPFWLEPGTRNKLTLLGRGLPGSKMSALRAADGVTLEALEVEVDVPQINSMHSNADGLVIPGAAGVPSFSYRFHSETGASNPVEIPLLIGARSAEPIDASGILNALNEAPQTVRMKSIPSVVSGFFTGGFAGARFEFEAKKGEVLVGEVFCQRLSEGHTNPFLRLEKSGAHLAEAYGPEVNAGSLRLNTQHNDPSLRFEVKEDGLYTLLLSDLSSAAKSARGAAYALQLRKESPDFSLVAANEPAAETAADRAAAPRGAVLRAGGTAALRVVALRTDGFKEAIQLSASQLPAGVHCEPTWIAAGKTEGVLILRAEPQVAMAVSMIRVEGRSRDGNLVRAARNAAVRWSITDYNVDTPSVRLSRGDGVVVATTATPAPLALIPQSPPVVDTHVGAKFEVPLTVKRSADFKETLKIKTAGAPGVESIKDVDADPKSENVKVIFDLAAVKMPEGLHSIYFTTQAKAKVAGRDVVTTVHSPVVQVRVAAAARNANAAPSDTNEVPRTADPAHPPPPSK